MTSAANITTVSDEDRRFIQDISRLPKEKKDLVKGIVIGLQLEEQQFRIERKNVGMGCQQIEKAKLSSAV